MTTTERLDPSPAAELLGRHGPTRLIGVGVREIGHDVTTLDWAADDAVEGVDVVHAAHAYVPVRLDGCGWDPVARARDRRQMAARMVANRAVQRLRERRPALQVTGSAIAGLPDDVLIELSQLVDVLVVGDDEAGPTRHRTITWRVQDRARCPVVCVPAGSLPSPDLPVTVVCGPTGPGAATVRFAARRAAARGATMQLLRQWLELGVGMPPTARQLAAEQECFDAQLEPWRREFPQVGMLARIELDDDWLGGARSMSSLIVVGQSAAPSVRTLPPVVGPTCPTAVVPDR